MKVTTTLIPDKKNAGKNVKCTFEIRIKQWSDITRVSSCVNLLQQNSDDPNSIVTIPPSSKKFWLDVPENFYSPVITVIIYYRNYIVGVAEDHLDSVNVRRAFVSALRQPYTINL